MVAILIGQGPRNREYRKAVSFTFEKGTEAKALEIQLRDDTGKLQPKLSVVEWGRGAEGAAAQRLGRGAQAAQRHG